MLLKVLSAKVLTSSKPRKLIQRDYCIFSRTEKTMKNFQCTYLKLEDPKNDQTTFAFLSTNRPPPQNPMSSIIPFDRLSFSLTKIGAKKRPPHTQTHAYVPLFALQQTNAASARFLANHVSPFSERNEGEGQS